MERSKTNKRMKQLNFANITESASTNVVDNNKVNAEFVQALKEAADYITDDVDHEGVRKACIRYHLIKGE